MLTPAPQPGDEVAFEVPPMPVPPLALPPLPAFPQQGTDVQRAEWYRLAELHQAEAQRLTCWQGHQAVAAMPALLGPTLDRLVDTWIAHDQALDRLSTAIAGLQLPQIATGTAGEGLTAGDVGIVKGLAEAIKSA
jgi:hypothetical protein